jgi:hypothetical protein
MKENSEDYEQMLLIQWMRRNYPEHRIFAIPNGGLRNKVVAMNMKATGTTKGIPDLMIPSLNCFIEMKRVKGGTISPEQLDWIIYLNNAGYHAKVCKGKDEAIDFIKYVLTTIK